MASSQRSDSTITPLRALAFRLSSTSGSNLIKVLPHLGSQLILYKELLSTPQPAHSEAAAIVHQLRTRTSSLLQDRSPESRLTAVVLVKALIEAGGYEILASNGGTWVRGLITMISRQDSTTNTTRKLAIIVVTRIIELAKVHDGLSRDIATPNLPPFVTTCLTVFEAVKDKWGSRQRALLETILRSWAQLLPRHPATFRPFIGRILKVLGKVISIPGEETEAELGDWEPTIKEAARTTYVLLHSSATKSGTLADRDNGFDIAFKGASNAINRTSTAYFGHDYSHIQNQNLPTETKVSTAKELCDHIYFVRAYINIPSFKPVTIAIGKVSSLLQQISSIPPSLQSNTGNSGRREKEQFLLDLPLVHIAALELVTAIISRFETASLAISIELLDCVLNIYDIQKQNPIVRGACYKVTTQIIQLIGPGMSVQQCTGLTPLIHHLCNDLLSIPTSPSTNQTTKSTTPTLSSKSILSNTTLITTTLSSSTHPASSPTTTSTSTASPALHAAATALLPTLLRHLPASALKQPVRTALDRTAVLTQHADALVASTLNAPVSYGAGSGAARPSLLPLAARCVDARVALEPLVRPRVMVGPGMAVGGGGGGGGGGEEETAELRGDGELGAGWYAGYDGAPRTAEVGEQDEGIDAMEGLEQLPEDGQNDMVKNSLEQGLESNPARKAFEKLQASEYGQPISKHTLDESEETASLVTSPSKRVRFEAMSESTSGPTRKEEGLLPVIEQKTGTVRRVQANINERSDESDDDDDSDFEVPPLVLAGDQDDDEDD